MQNGRSIAPLINDLLHLPGFVIKIATKDFHPITHISFASNHPPPNNKPFESIIEMRNPCSDDERDTKPQRLWPVHCVQGEPGASIIPEIDIDWIDDIVTKGMDERVEMYSAFADAFGNICVETGGVNVDLARVLREHHVTDVFIVGVAGDYCVKHTAIDATKGGVRSYVVEDAVKCVDPGNGWEIAKDELARNGVQIVGIHGPELSAVRDQG